MTTAPVTITSTATPTITAAAITDFLKWVDRGPRTTAAYLGFLKSFAAWTALKGITAPTRDDVIAYRDWLQSEHEAITYTPGTPEKWSYQRDRHGKTIRRTCAPSTVAQYLRAVRAFFRWAAGAGLYPDITDNIHAPRLDRHYHRKEALQAPAVKAIGDSIARRAAEKIEASRRAQKDTAGRVQRADEQGRRLKAIYALAVTEGFRTVELSRARVRDFVRHGKEAWIYVWGKGHTEADTPKAIAPQVAALIADYLDHREAPTTADAPLFAATGNRHQGGRIAPSTFSRMLKKAMQDAGFSSDRLTAHSLRHTAGTACLELTGDPYRTRDFMRHASITTTEIYMHVETAKEEGKLAAQLFDFLFSGGAKKSGPDAICAQG